MYCCILITGLQYVYVLEYVVHIKFLVTDYIAQGSTAQYLHRYFCCVAVKLHRYSEVNLQMLLLKYRWSNYPVTLTAIQKNFNM